MPTFSFECSRNRKRIFSWPMRENHGNVSLTSTKPQVWAEKKNPWTARVSGNHCNLLLVYASTTMATIFPQNKIVTFHFIQSILYFIVQCNTIMLQDKMPIRYRITKPQDATVKSSWFSASSCVLILNKICRINMQKIFQAFIVFLNCQKTWEAFQEEHCPRL